MRITKHRPIHRIGPQPREVRQPTRATLKRRARPLSGVKPENPCSSGVRRDPLRERRKTAAWCGGCCSQELRFGVW